MKKKPPAPEESRIDVFRKVLLTALYDKRRQVSDELSLLELVRLEFEHGRKEVARYEDGVLYLNRDHRLVQGAYQRFDRDPTCVWFLLSAMYTAVNLGMHEITDDHERDLQRMHAESVSQSLARMKGR